MFNSYAALGLPEGWRRRYSERASSRFEIRSVAEVLYLQPLSHKFNITLILAVRIAFSLGQMLEESQVVGKRVRFRTIVDGTLKLMEHVSKS